MKELQEKENICNGIYINVVCFRFSAAKDCKAWEGNVLRRAKRIQKTYQTLQIYGIVLWNTVIHQRALWNCCKDIVWK